MNTDNKNIGGASVPASRVWDATAFAAGEVARGFNRSRACENGAALPAAVSYFAFSATAYFTVSTMTYFKVSALSSPGSLTGTS
jgi:hypothetical protein